MAQNETLDVSEIEGQPMPAPGRRMRRLITLALAIAVALVSVAVWQALSSSDQSSSSALVGPRGMAAPPFALAKVSHPSQTLSLSDFRGRDLVINFWASWCVPCRTEMPLLEASFRSERGKVVFVGIDTNDTSNAAQAFLARVHVTYPAVSDPNGNTAVAYGLFGLPTTVFISPSGRIVGRHIGQLRADTLRAAMQEAFGA
jgi:cytochrome c biogenesis protein CcmG/thiol:disulfide interchange protein DsbE